MRFISVVLPQPFSPTIMLTPGLKINSLPFWKLSKSERYLIGDFLLSLITTLYTIILVNHYTSILFAPHLVLEDFNLVGSIVAWTIKHYYLSIKVFIPKVLESFDKFPSCHSQLKSVNPANLKPSE